VAKEREMTSKKTIKFLTDCRICNPVVLARLADDGLSFDVPQIIHAMYNQAGHPDRFIEAVKDGLEQGIVSPKDAVAVQALYEIGVTMGDRQFNRFARVLCDQARSKKVCGQVLTVFSSHLQVLYTHMSTVPFAWVFLPSPQCVCVCGCSQTAEAASFICDVVSYDFFMDLRGKLKTFLAALPGGLAERVEQLLKDTRTLDRDGDLIDRCDNDGKGVGIRFIVSAIRIAPLTFCHLVFASDADEKGNLAGFVEDDMSGDGGRGDDSVEGEWSDECGEGEEEEEEEEEEDEEEEDEDEDEDEDEEADDEEEYDDEIARRMNRAKHAAAAAAAASSSSSSSCSSSWGGGGGSGVAPGRKLHKASAAADDEEEIDFTESPEGKGKGGNAGGKKGGQGRDDRDSIASGGSSSLPPVPAGGRGKKAPLAMKAEGPPASKKRRIDDDDEDD